MEGLVLTRKEGESLVLDLRLFCLGLVEVGIVRMKGNRVTVLVDAQENIRVLRREVFDVIENDKQPEATR